MGGSQETSLHENLLVCVLPAHADNRLCGTLVGDKRWKRNRRKTTRKSIDCADCDNKRKDEEMSCVVTM